MEDIDLDTAWGDVIKSFERTSRVKLAPDKVLSPQNVLDQLKLYDKNEEAKKKHRRLKKALERTLQCVRNFSLIASQDQTQLFGPTNLVFAAIVTLINAGTSYSMINERMEELFRVCADILERWAVYDSMRDNLDLPLRKIIHGFFQSIVRICALSMKVLNGNKLTKYLKVLAFSEDGDVKKELDMLRSRVEHEASMLSSLNYRAIKEGFDRTKNDIYGVRKLAEDLTRKDAENADQRMLEMIKARLAVRNSVERQQVALSHFRSEAVQDSGNWLISDIENWSDNTQDCTELVLLSANEGHGKTFLCTKVVSSLMKGQKALSLAESSSRNVVGYYYVQAGHDSHSSGLHDDAEEIFDVSRILKTVALQFCHDAVYRKHLSVLCDSWTPEPDDPLELYEKLMDQCYRSSSTFFMVIDGIDRASESQLNGLVSLLSSINHRYDDSQRSRVRVLLSGREKVMETLGSSLKAGHLNYRTIDVEDNSHEDIEIFVRDRLNNMSLLAGDSSSIKTLRQEIHDALTTMGGDFVNISLIFQEISSKSWPAEVRHVLSTQRGGLRADTIGREVSRCNTTLTEREISDLNTLLLWVMCSRRNLRVSELEAVLFLKNGEAPLRSLRDQLDKYTVFFHVYKAPDSGPETSQGWMVSLSSDSIRQYFGEAARQEDVSVLSSNKVQDAEVKIVRRFLSSVCDESLYAKFGFDEFFARALGNSTTFVHVDLSSSSSTLLLGCLTAMASQAEEAQALLDYAGTFFTKHMSEIDLALTAPSVKFEIGRQLLPVLTDSEVIERWTEALPKEIVSQMFFSEEAAELILGTIRDTAISKSFAEERKGWIRELSAANVLGDVVKSLSKKLFGSSSWGWAYKLLFSILLAFKSKSERLQNGPKGELKNFEVSSRLIIDVFTWVAGLLDLESATDYEFNRGLARILRLFNNLDEAIAQYQVAINCSKTTDTWLARYGLANALFDKEEYSDAAQLFFEIEHDIVDNKAKDNNAKQYLRQIRNALANSHLRLEEWDDALRVYDKHLAEEQVMDYDFAWNRLYIFRRKDEPKKIIESLKELREQVDPYFAIKRSSRLLHWMSDTSGGMQEVMVGAARATDASGFYRQLLEEAIQDVQKPDYLSSFPQVKADYRAYLKLALSEELWRTASTKKNKDDAVKSYEELLDDALDIGNEDVYSQTAKRLALVYSESLQQYKPSAPEVPQLIQKITQLATKDNGNAWATTLNATLVVCRYYAKNGLVEEARELGRASVQTGLDLLSDEDPDNDWEAFLRLATVFMYCGEDENALAAWSLLLPRQLSSKPNLEGSNDDDSEQEAPHSIGTNSELSQDEAENLKGLQGELDYFCDGFCNTRWSFADDIYVCSDCLDMMWCAPCYKRLKRDEIGDNVCGADHIMLHVPKFSMSEARTRGKAKVRFKDQNVPVSEWLDQIRKDWRLDLSGSADVAADRADGRSFADDWQERSRLKLESRKNSWTATSW